MAESVTRMSSKYGLDSIDGVERPRLVVSGDYTLRDVHQGGVHIEAGHFQLDGVIQGSLDLQAGVSASVKGRQQGSVSIAAGTEVIVTGAIEGSVHVSAGARVIIEPGGKLAGSLDNDGEVVVRGVFGGAARGNPVSIEGAGYVKEPLVRDGVHYYDWS